MKVKEVTKIKLKDLEQFLTSDLLKNSTKAPISPERAKSYLNNPNALPDDYVLYLLVDENEIIAFRSIFGDQIQYEGETLRFAWLSGVWVNPNYRGNGLSIQLLMDVYEDWNENLCFTNYAPISVQANLGTGYFHLLKSRNGRRFYTNESIHQMLLQRSSLKLLKPFLHLLRPFFFMPPKFGLNEIERTTKIKVSSTPTKLFLKLFDDFKTYRFFNRDSEELKWIIENPWITTSNEVDERYPFSRFDDSFQYRFFTAEKIGSRALMMISIRKRNAKLLYIQGDIEVTTELMKSLANFCFENNILHLTILEENIAEQFSKLNHPFKAKRNFTMNIYTTMDVKIPKDVKVNDGDGDNIFT